MSREQKLTDEELQEILDRLKSYGKYINSQTLEDDAEALEVYIQTFHERITELKKDREAVIVKIEEMNKPTLREPDAYELGWTDACDSILGFIRNPKEAAKGGKGVRDE